MASQNVILHSAFNPEQLAFPADVLVNARGAKSVSVTYGHNKSKLIL